MADQPQQSGPNPENLYNYVENSLRTTEFFHFMGFEMLQRLNIVYLQDKLVKMKIKTKKYSGLDSFAHENLKITLDDYGL